MKTLGLAFLLSLPLFGQGGFGGGYTPPGSSGGGGTVTDVSVVTANGVSGSVATSTTTPAITLTLGNITPTSVSTGGTPPSLTPGTGGAFALAEGTVPSVCAASAVICIYGDSTQHGVKASFNNGSYLPLVQGPASATSGHVATFNGTNGGLLQDGGALPTVTGGACTNQFVRSLNGSAVPTCNTVSLTADISGIAPVANGGAVAQGSNACGTSDLCASGNLTQAQIVSLTSTGSSWINVIAAPASGSMILVDQFFIESAYNGTAYGGGSVVELFYGTAAVPATGATCGNTNLTTAQKSICTAAGAVLNVNNVTSYNATAINIGVNGASFTCGSTCGPLYYWVKYRIVTGLQ